MKEAHSIRGWWVGGFVAVTIVVVSLVLISGLALVAAPGSPEVQPVPVPTPPAMQPAHAPAAASVAVRPAPRPVPTPAEGGGLPNGQASELPLLVAPGLLALAVLGLVAVQRRACPPRASARQVARPSLAPCQEGAR